MKRIFTVAVVLMLGMSAWALAGPPHPGGKGGSMGHGPDLLQTWFELDLNDSQKKQAATILAAHRQEILDARQAMRQAFEKAHEFRPQPGRFDEAALRKGHALISGAMIEEMVLREKVVSELYAILTPEQQKIVEARFSASRSPEHGRDGAPGFDKDMGDDPHGPKRGLPLLDAFIKAFG